MPLRTSLDDIFVYSKNAEEHLEHVKKVVLLLRKHKLYAKMAKCVFMQPELNFSEHIVGGQGLQVGPQEGCHCARLACACWGSSVRVISGVD